MSTFVTSFTTSAAFCANATTKIISVKCFGLYAGIVILCDYILMITYLPAVVVYYDNAVCGSHTREAEDTGEFRRTRNNSVNSGGEGNQGEAEQGAKRRAHSANIS